MKANRNNQGFSLIELMIAMLIGMIVLLGVFSIFGQTLRNNRDVIGSARLNQDLGTVATIMANDIRRAGYSGGGLPVYGGGDPALWFNARDADLNIVKVNSLPSCILYSYNLDLDNPDLNDDGVVNATDQTADDTTPVIDTNEFFGFKLSTTTINGATVGFIEMRRFCDPTANSGDRADPTNSCYTNCTAGTWESITDPNVVNITELSFSTIGSRCMDSDTRNYWTIKETAGTATTYTDDPIKFPCENHTNSSVVPSANRTSLSEVNFMVRSGTPSSYTASNNNTSAWAASELLIPRTQAWATANAQTSASSTQWDSAVETREINIHIRGQLTTDATVQKETHTQVKVGNHRIFVAPTPP